MRVPERSFDPVARGSGFALPRFGQTYFVHASDIAALPIRVGVAARRRRLFHPNGVLAEGILERIAPPDEGLPMNSCDVISRVSKGIGLPGALPDIASLAWRIPPTPDLRSCTPWDVLLASTVANTRVVLAPMRSWSSSTFSSLTPFRFRGGVWWVRARLITKIDEPGLSLDPIRNQIDSGELDFRYRAGPGHWTVRATRAPDPSSPRSQQRRHRIRSRAALRRGRRAGSRMAAWLPSRRVPAQPRRQRRRVTE